MNNLKIKEGRQIGLRIDTGIPEAATFHLGGAVESRDRPGPAAGARNATYPFLFNSF